MINKRFDNQAFRACGASRLHGLRRAISYFLFIISYFLFPVLTACDRYEIELYYDGHADVHTTFDWMTRFGTKPEGMTFMWAKDSDVISYFDPTYRVDERTDQPTAGTYYVTTMNKTFGEYSTMKFYNRNSHNDLTAVSNTYYITSDNAWDKGRTYMEEPEDIGVAVDTFTVGKTVDDLEFYPWRERHQADTMRIERKQVIEPMTTVLNIHVKVRGISYMRSIDGYITGLANGFLLNQAWRTTEVGSLKLEHWERDLTRAGDDTEANVGWMNCSVRTFGLPHGRELLKQRTPSSNYIFLHFTLLDGRTVDFSYLVGQNIRYDGDTGEMEVFARHDVTLELDLVIDAPFYGNDEVPIMPYAQPEGSGQFDAQVEPWGDDVNVDVPM